MNSTDYCYRSPFADGIEAYLAHKRTLGRRFRAEASVLRLLDRYLVEQRIHTINQVTSQVLDAFLASRPRRKPRSYNHLLGSVRRLLDWLVLHEVIPASPLCARPKRSGVPSRPFLFDITQARRLLDAAARLSDAPNAQLRGQTYEMVYALLYGLGLRVSEAARLRRQDVDFDRDLLSIRHTKFGKSRLVPFGPRLSARLCRYIDARKRRFGPLQPECAVFSFAKNSERSIYAPQLQLAP